MQPFLYAFLILSLSKSAPGATAKPISTRDELFPGGDSDFFGTGDYDDFLGIGGDLDFFPRATIC